MRENGSFYGHSQVGEQSTVLKHSLAVLVILSYPVLLTIHLYLHSDSMPALLPLQPTLKKPAPSSCSENQDIIIVNQDPQSPFVSDPCSSSQVGRCDLYGSPLIAG